MQATKPVLAESVQAKPDGLGIVVEGRQFLIPWQNCSPLLARATWEQRQNLELSPGGYGIHWPLIDEDLSVAGLLSGTRV